jgi:thiamine biosynthesis lipoprotein
MLSAAKASWVLVEETQRIMATPCQVYLAVPPEREAGARAALEACFGWLREVDTTLTRFAAESELSRLNAAGGQWCEVSPMLFEVVEASRTAARDTSGLFDPALLPVLEYLGYDRDFASLAHREVSPARERSQPTDGASASLGRWREIELDAAGRRIRLPMGVRLDLGGIAKGWAADRALDRFFASFSNVIVSVGGDMRVRGGAQPGECWPIGVGDTIKTTSGGTTEHAAVVAVGRGGLATSGAGDRWWLRGGERQHHLIDPRTGQPARVWLTGDAGEAESRPLIATATALAPSAAEAEVAAKVALLRGYPDALTQVEAAWRTPMATEADAVYRDEHVALLLALGTGEVVCSANLREYLEIFGGEGNVWLS